MTERMSRAEQEAEQRYVRQLAEWLLGECLVMSVGQGIYLVREAMRVDGLQPQAAAQQVAETNWLAHLDPQQRALQVEAGERQLARRREWQRANYWAKQSGEGE